MTQLTRPRTAVAVLCMAAAMSVTTIAAPAQASLIGDTVTISVKVSNQEVGSTTAIVSAELVELTAENAQVALNVIYRDPLFSIDVIAIDAFLTLSVDVGSATADVRLTVSKSMNFVGGNLLGASADDVCASLVGLGLMDAPCAAPIGSHTYRAAIQSLDWGQLAGVLVVEEYGVPCSPAHIFPCYQAQLGNWITAVLVMQGDFPIWCDGCTVSETLSADLIVAAQVAEPATLLLLASGVAGLAGLIWRTRRRAA